MTERNNGTPAETKRVNVNVSLAYYAKELEDPRDDSKIHRLGLLDQFKRMFTRSDIVTLIPKSSSVALNINGSVEKRPIEKVFFCGWEYDPSLVQISAVFQVSNGVELTVGTASLSSVIESYDVEHQLVELVE